MPIRGPTACGDRARPARMLPHRRPRQPRHSKPGVHGKCWSPLPLTSKPQASSGWERGSRETGNMFFVEKRMVGMTPTGRALCRLKGSRARHRPSAVTGAHQPERGQVFRAFTRS